jgi:hypothetical protein
MRFLCPKFTFPKLYVQLAKNLKQIFVTFQNFQKKIDKDARQKI